MSSSLQSGTVTLSCFQKRHGLHTKRGCKEQFKLQNSGYMYERTQKNANSCNVICLIYDVCLIFHAVNQGSAKIHGLSLESIHVKILDVKLRAFEQARFYHYHYRHYHYDTFTDQSHCV